MSKITKQRLKCTTNGKRVRENKYLTDILNVDADIRMLENKSHSY